VVGDIAHELRNSLASIAGCAETLIEQDARINAPTRLALLEVIRRQARDLDALVRELAARLEPAEDDATRRSA
jgi:signal transduction histidine kinase